MAIPKAVEGVPAEVLNPAEAWADKAAFEKQNKKVADLFTQAFKRLVTESRTMSPELIADFRFDR